MATVYAVASARGGVGKTTTTAALATVLADSGADVVAIDADLGMANLADAVGVTPGEITIHDVLAGDADPAAAVREGPSGLRVVPGAADLDAYAAADPSRLRGVVEAFDGADYVFVDAGAGLSHDSTLPLAIADETLLVSTPERSALGDTEKTRQLTERLGGTVAGAAITRVTADADEVVTALLDASVLGRIPEDEAVARAAAAGRSLPEAAPDAPATRAYRDLTRALTGAEVEGAGLDGSAAGAASGAGADDAEGDGEPTATDDDAVIVDDGPAADDADDGGPSEVSERDAAGETDGDAAAEAEADQDEGTEPESDEDIIVADPDASGVAEPGDGDDIIVASESEPPDCDADEKVSDDAEGDVGDDTEEGGDDGADGDVSDDTDGETRDARGDPKERVENDEPTREAVGDAASDDEAGGTDAGDESMAGGRAAAELEATGPEAETEEEPDAIPDADETAREAATERGEADGEGTTSADPAADDIDDELAGSIPFRDDDTGTMNTVLSDEDEPDGDAGREATDDADASSADEEEEEGDGGFFSRLLGR
ncbi:cobyrinic acid ac-diamide synthase [Halorubrum ezzemoulense DSM 17463]|uniref:Cobyrinic acid ac-diamide synthase n=1 Tax=Halorubrum ezzemoulense DSM 17463 TaxID=1121945 RepID=A0A1X4HAY5_HALEZ|nr:P-loop NTPase [Halorubrum ezzemoulense]OSP10217.1 cobyrinic acid ac-diamide synthase [Halorubrum ezzemoulense DSM 17463]